MSMLSKGLVELEIRRLLKRRAVAEAALAAEQSAKTSALAWLEFNEADKGDIDSTAAEFDEDLAVLQARVDKLAKQQALKIAEYKGKQE